MSYILDEPSAIDTRFENLWALIGNTPMLAIRYIYKGRRRTIYAKSEHYNLTGSIKDRMAAYILQQAYQQGHIKSGDRIVEATSGNTGISMAAIGKALGHDVTIIMPDWLSRERMDIIRTLGASIITVSKQQGGFKGSIALSEEMFRENENIFLPRQFENTCNVTAHEKTTGREIWEQLSQANLLPDAFVAGVGTGGTVMGVAKFLKAKNSVIRIHPLEPLESPTLSTGYKIGSHRIQGISDEFIPAILDLQQLDEIIAVSDGDAIIMTQMMASCLGLAVGISSGANILGAIKAQNKLRDDAVVATVLPDSNKKYLSTDLVKGEPVKDGYLSPDVRLLDYSTVKKKTAQVIG